MAVVSETLDEEVQMKAYVVKGVRTVNGESETVWLAYHLEGGGAYQWTSNNWRQTAHPFTSKKVALDAAHHCKGPHFNVPAKDSITVLDAEYEPPRDAVLTISDHMACG